MRYSIIINSTYGTHDFFFFFFLRTSSARGGGGAAILFLFLFFSCSADHERDWPPCKVGFSGWQPMR